MKSLGAKVKQLEAMVGTSDLNERETKFVTDMARMLPHTNDMTTGQTEWLERLYDRHFGDG